MTRIQGCEHPRTKGASAKNQQEAAKQSDPARMDQMPAEVARDKLLDGIESALEGFVLYDLDDRMVLFNTRFKELFVPEGLRIQTGMLFEEFIRAAARIGLVPLGDITEEEWIAQRLERHLRTRPTEQIAAQQRDVDQDLRAPYPRRGPGRGHTDITELEEQREHLEELVATTAAAVGRAQSARRRLLDAIESALEGFALYDADDRLVVYNSQYRDLFSGPGSTILPDDPILEKPGRDSKT